MNDCTLLTYTVHRVSCYARQLTHWRQFSVRWRSTGPAPRRIIENSSWHNSGPSDVYTLNIQSLIHNLCVRSARRYMAGSRWLWSDPSLDESPKTSIIIKAILQRMCKSFQNLESLQNKMTENIYMKSKASIVIISRQRKTGQVILYIYERYLIYHNIFWKLYMSTWATVNIVSDTGFPLTWRRYRPPPRAILEALEKTISHPSQEDVQPYRQPI